MKFFQSKLQFNIFHSLLTNKLLTDTIAIILIFIIFTLEYLKMETLMSALGDKMHFFCEDDVEYF